MLFPLEIWDIIITYADIDALVRLSGVSSYFLTSCEPYLETASRACFPWAQKSLLGEPDGSEGTWRLSALRIIAMRHLRPDFINPTGTQKNCKDTPLRRFPDFNSNDHTSRPFFYDSTHTVIKGVPLDDVAKADAPPQANPAPAPSNSALIYPVGGDTLRGNRRSLWTSASEPTETEGHFYQVYSDLNGYYLKVYLEVIDKTTFKSRLFQVPIDDDTERPLDAVSAHNDRLFVTVAKRRSFLVFYFNPNTAKFYLVLRATGHYGMFTQNRVLADLNTIRVLSHEGYFFNYELHGLYTAPDFEPKTIIGFTSNSPKWSHFCYLSHPRSKLKSTRYVAWFADANDFDLRKNRQSLMCVVADLKEYRMWRVPMHCALLVVGLYHNTIGCWLLDKDMLVTPTRGRRKLLLEKTVAKWRSDPEEFWVIK